MKSKKAVKYLLHMRDGFGSAKKYGFNHVEFLWDKEKKLNNMIKSLEIGIQSTIAMRKLSKILNLECPTNQDYNRALDIIDKWEFLCKEMKIEVNADDSR